MWYIKLPVGFKRLVKERYIFKENQQMRQDDHSINVV
jgi:hypothetical protein